MTRDILIIILALALFVLAVPERNDFYSSVLQNTGIEELPVERLPATAVLSEPQAEPAGTINNGKEIYYPVIKVIDGDTITVNINGKSETIRLIGLDTPETVDPRKPVQCFGEEASKKAKEVLAGKKVRIEMDPSQGKVDKYGRTLAYIFLPDGRSFNKLMIAEGYGHEYTYNLPYKYQQEFKDAEKIARENQKGLWETDACAQSPVIEPKETSSAMPEITPASGSYDCSRNAYNCSSFKMQAEAQMAFETCGGTSNDIHKLDRDGDGKVCESLP